MHHTTSIGYPTNYDIRQNRTTWSIWMIIMVLLAIVGGVTLIWSLLNSLVISGINNKANTNENNIRRIQKQLAGQYQKLSEKGEPDGYAPLNINSIVPDANLPPNLLEAATYQGCWDASINFPVLTSSAGTNGEFFVVCVAGSTSLNGFSTWNQYDLVLFDASLNSWLRIDGGVNLISNAGSVGAGEFSLIDNGVGPFFKMYKVQAAGEIEITLINGETLLFNATGGPTRRSTDDSIPSSHSEWGHYRADIHFVPVLMTANEFSGETHATIKAHWIPGLTPVRSDREPVACQFHRTDVSMFSMCTVDFSVDENHFDMVPTDTICKDSNRCILAPSTPLSVKMKMYITSFSERPRASNIPAMGLGTLQQLDDNDHTTVLRNCGHFSAYLDKSGSSIVLSGEITPECNGQGSVWRLTWTSIYESIGID